MCAHARSFPEDLARAVLAAVCTLDTQEVHLVRVHSPRTGSVLVQGGMRWDVPCGTGRKGRVSLPSSPSFRPLLGGRGRLPGVGGVCFTECAIRTPVSSRSALTDTPRSHVSSVHALAGRADTRTCPSQAAWSTFTWSSGRHHRCLLLSHSQPPPRQPPFCFLSVCTGLL